MARQARLAIPGELHLVMLRGHNCQPVFVDDQDRATYLAMLRAASVQHQVAIHAYALLEDSVHLLATPTDTISLSRLMQSLGRRYVAAFNRRHGRSGTLWDGRFRAGPVGSRDLAVAAMVFVEAQAVASGLCPNPGQWQWSSAAHHLGQRSDPVVAGHPGYWALGNTPFERESAYANFSVEGVLPGLAEQLRKSTLGRRPATLRGRPPGSRNDKKTVPIKLGTG